MSRTTRSTAVPARPQSDDMEPLRQQNRTLYRELRELNRRLEEEGRSKSQFLSNVRNEINNPLGAIIGLADRIARADRPDPSRVRSFAQLIHDEAAGLSFQMENIIVAAELEEGQAALDISTVCIGSLLDEVLGRFARRISAKQLKVTARTGGHGRGERRALLLFPTDARKIGLIITNLLANAIEFNVRGGEVEIEAGEVSGWLRLRIRDTGAGISREGLKRLYQRFHQLSRGPGKLHRGHGLGLCLCKGLLDLLGGEITVTSERHAGVQVTVTLPPAELPDGTTARAANEQIFRSPLPAED